MWKGEKNIMSRMDTPDRDVLDKVIVPYYNTGKLCFVGIDNRTRHYIELCKADEVIILDKKVHSHSNLQGKLQYLSTLTGENYFDTIIANGLAFGGTDSASEVEAAFQGAYDALKPNGFFIWGWSDCDERRIIDPIFIPHKFDYYIFPPLGTWRYSSLRHIDPDRAYHWEMKKIIRINHTYDFYQKVLKENI
jgi:hypothetical protein